MQWTNDKESEDSFLNTVETENSDEVQRETVEEDKKDNLFSAMNQQRSSTCVKSKRKKKGRKSGQKMFVTNGKLLTPPLCDSEFFFPNNRN